MLVAEIVEITEDALLRSGTAGQAYMARGGHGLRAGFYLVLRAPHPDGAVCYDQKVHYYGPYPRRAIAEQLKRSAVYLSALVPGSEGRHGVAPVRIVEAAPAGCA